MKGMYSVRNGGRRSGGMMMRREASRMKPKSNVLTKTVIVLKILPH